MIYWLFIACIVLAALIGGALCLFWAAQLAPNPKMPSPLSPPPQPQDDCIRLGEAEWLDRHPEIRFRRTEGHDIQD